MSEKRLKRRGGPDATAKMLAYVLLMLFLILVAILLLAGVVWMGVLVRGGAI